MEDGVAGMPHGFDFGGVGASEAVEGGEGYVLGGSAGGYDFGVWFGVEGVEAALGILLGGQGTIPIAPLRRLLSLLGRHAGQCGPTPQTYRVFATASISASASAGENPPQTATRQYLRKVRGSQLIQQLLLRLIL